MLHKLLFFGVIAIVIIISAALIGSCHRRFGHCGRHGSHEKKVAWFLKKLSKELALNENQKKELTRIKDEIKTKHEVFKGTKKEMLDAILLEVKSETVDQEKLKQLFKDKETEMQEMRSFFISKFAEFHSILEPEQRSKLAEKMSEFHKKCN